MTPLSPYIRYGSPPFTGGSNHKQQRVVGAAEPLEVGSSLLPIQDRVAVGRPARPAQGRSACARRRRGRLGSFRGVGTWASRHLSNFSSPSRSLRLCSRRECFRGFAFGTGGVRDHVQVFLEDYLHAGVSEARASFYIDHDQPPGSSVAAPCRAALGAADHAVASAKNLRITGRGLSRQAWVITEKIKQVDDAITPAFRPKLGTPHPKGAFRNGQSPATTTAVRLGIKEDYGGSAGTQWRFQSMSNSMNCRPNTRRLSRGLYAPICDVTVVLRDVHSYPASIADFCGDSGCTRTHEGV